MGDPAGIGPEITLRTWLAGRSRRCFVWIGCASLLEETAEALKLSVPVRRIGKSREAAEIWPHALPVLDCPLPAPVTPGVPSAGSAPAVIGSIEKAVALVQQGEAAAVVTNPIAKSVLQAAGFPYPGHTEFLAKLGGINRPVMMLASPLLRVVPITIHIPLAEVPNRLTTDLIVETARITHAGLKRHFGLTRPRLALSGLNPHAGEDGRMGREEQTVIAPAIRRLRDEGMDVSGPLPADTMFHPGARDRYDVALCMYHDQALIPIKTLDFAGGVNVTLGLPFIRTSPDHGTAFDIAGQGVADAASLLAALSLADEMSRND
jgi:4-hydroxythreonine-4-phosphate dehydrogenase